ncbi:hypothetical protein [Streptosporangium sp. NPDC002524]|uniref:hypothetical protein n=1 Tax=Streptosporangium sp. NPDC002524 TaxID=3154537 RepID=UPI00331E5774
MTGNKKLYDAAKALAAAEGIPFTRARTRILADLAAAKQSGHQQSGHQHPASDLGFLADAPYEQADLELAAALVGACRAGCSSCQATLIPKVLAGNRATVGALATISALMPAPMGLSSAVPRPVREWNPLARQALEDDNGAAALAALEAMTPDDLDTILDFTLNMWAFSGASIKPVVLDLDDPDVEDELGPVYTLLPGIEQTPHGPLPLLLLEPETNPAGAEDLSTRCAWPRWDAPPVPGSDPVFPDPDPRWRVRLNIGGRAVEEIARVDDEGFDDITVWRAPEPLVRMPDEWWDLVDRVQHVLLCGPVFAHGRASAAEALAAAAATSTGVMAVLATTSFW